MHDLRVRALAGTPVRDRAARHIPLDRIFCAYTKLCPDCRASSIHRQKVAIRRRCQERPKQHFRIDVSLSPLLRYGLKMDFSYLLYFLIVVGLAALLSAALGRFRDEPRIPSRKDDQDFERRMAKVERQAEQARLKRMKHQEPGAGEQ